MSLVHSTSLVNRSATAEAVRHPISAWKKAVRDGGTDSIAGFRMPSTALAIFQDHLESL